MEEKILVTGCAGFIGFHVCKHLLNKGLFVVGLDNLNDYSDVLLKKARLKEIDKFSKKHKGEFLFIKSDLKDENSLKNISDVKSTHVRDYIRVLNDRRMAPTSISRIISSIRTYYRFLSSENILNEKKTRAEKVLEKL